MSVNKLLSRIVVALSRIDVVNEGNGMFRRFMIIHTVSLTSTPLTQFACVFAALIHDVDHIGVPNAQLNNREDAEMTSRYGFWESVSVPNSWELSWKLLLENRFVDKLAALCPVIGAFSLRS
jgi:hypothetical protein